MRHGLIAAFVIAACWSPASAESVSDAIKRIEARLQQLELANAKLSGLPGPRGAQGAPGARGQQGPVGPPGPRGRDATLDGIDALTLGQKARVSLGLIDNGRPAVRLYDASGKKVGFFGQYQDGDRGFSVADDDDETQRSRSTAIGPVSICYEAAGSAYFPNPGRCSVISVNGANGPTAGLFLNGVDGKRAVELSSHGDGARVRVNGKRIHDYAEILELADRDGIAAGSVVAWDPGARGAGGGLGIELPADDRRDQRRGRVPPRHGDRLAGGRHPRLPGVDERPRPRPGQPRGRDRPARRPPGAVERSGRRHARRRPPPPGPCSARRSRPGRATAKASC